MESKIINNPPNNWVELLRPGHRVFLPKEQREAMVGFAYEPPEPGYRTGRLGISPNFTNSHIQSWFVGANGEGVDGKPLIQPLEGHLPSNPDPIPEPLARQILRQMDHLNQRMDVLERGADPFFGYYPVISKFPKTTSSSWWEKAKSWLNQDVVQKFEDV